MDELFSTLIIFGFGLAIGWNVLPQPEWVRRLYVWVAERVKDW